MTRPWIIPVFVRQLDELEAIVDAYLLRGSERELVEVAIYGGSFANLGSEVRRDVYRRLRPFLRQAQSVTGLRVTAGPAEILPDLPRELVDGGVRTIELNVCSMDDGVLEAAGRVHTVGDVQRAVELCRDVGLQVGLRIHPGLPGSSSAKILATGKAIVDLAPDFVRIYPVLVLSSTELAEAYARGEYVPMTLEETVKICKKLVCEFNNANVSVARVGLQPRVDLADPRQVIAGPYHPSLRFLVDAALAYDRAFELILAEFRFARALRIWVPPREDAALRGEKGSNIKKLKQRFKLLELVVEADPDLAAGTLRLERLPTGDVPSSSPEP